MIHGSYNIKQFYIWTLFKRVF
jgi:hypothetical protein